MAADAAEGAVEPAYARLVGGDVVHQPGAARVVEVRDGLTPMEGAEHAFDVRRGRGADRVAKRDVFHAEAQEALVVGEHGPRVDAALERAAEGARDGADQAEAALRGLRHLGDVLPLLLTGAVEVLARVRVGRRDEEADFARA